MNRVLSSKAISLRRNATFRVRALISKYGSSQNTVLVHFSPL